MSKSMTFCLNDFARMLLYQKNIINVFETSGKNVFGQMALDKCVFGHMASGKKVSDESLFGRWIRANGRKRVSVYQTTRSTKTKWRISPLASTAISLSIGKFSTFLTLQVGNFLQFELTFSVILPSLNFYDTLPPNCQPYSKIFPKAGVILHKLLRILSTNSYVAKKQLKIGESGKSI